MFSMALPRETRGGRVALYVGVVADQDVYHTESFHGKILGQKVY